MSCARRASTAEQIQAAVRIAAVVHAVAAVLDGEGAAARSGGGRIAVIGSSQAY